MKRSELKQLIKEEIEFILKEDESLTEEQYNKYIGEFGKGNLMLDYIVRCWTIGDEEEFQILDNEENSINQEWVEDLPLETDQKEEFFELFQKAKSESDPDILRDFIETNLKPKVANFDLYQKDYGLWEDLLFASAEDKPYETFITDRD